MLSEQDIAALRFRGMSDKATTSGPETHVGVSRKADKTYLQRVPGKRRQVATRPGRH